MPSGVHATFLQAGHLISPTCPYRYPLTLRSQILRHPHTHRPLWREMPRIWEGVGVVFQGSQWDQPDSHFWNTPPAWWPGTSSPWTPSSRQASGEGPSHHGPNRRVTRGATSRKLKAWLAFVSGRQTSRAKEGKNKSKDEQGAVRLVVAALYYLSLH